MLGENVYEYLLWSLYSVTFKRMSIRLSSGVSPGNWGLNQYNPKVSLSLHRRVVRLLMQQLSLPPKHKSRSHFQDLGSGVWGQLTWQRVHLPCRRPWDRAQGPHAGATWIVEQVLQCLSSVSLYLSFLSPLSKKK